jgi:argininosuccinate lyase
MFDYTAGDDRPWDARLLRWDVLGSLGHVAGLRASRLLTPREHERLRAGLRAALARVDAGRLTVSPRQEDVHTAAEAWLTGRLPGLGERLHTGRSRNDQVATDLRLYLKDRLLALHAGALAAADALLAFAARHQTTLWPGYTHQRRAMPSSVGLWAAGYAEGLLDTAEELPALWARVDRSPLGSAAGYGAPLPLKREAAARALGFGGLDHNVATVQGGRGKLEAAALFWCTQLGHELGRLAQDVILFSAEEYGYLVLPAALATGSSIMPHKRNPDLFELTRARAAALEGDLATVLQIKGKLAGGYQRDFQLLKEPLMRGLDRTEAMLAIIASALPQLGVDHARCAAALQGGALATDEVMRRVEAGQAFRTAYRDVSAELIGGARFPAPSARALVSRRRSTGGLGNLGLGLARGRLRRAAAWQRRERRRFDGAMARLAGRSLQLGGRRSDGPSMGANSRRPGRSNHRPSPSATRSPGPRARQSSS